MLTSWQLDPVLIGGIISIAVAYSLATGPLRPRLSSHARFERGKAVLFYSALVILFLAEASPLHDLAEIYLFSAHMVQHVILSYVVPPLLIAGTPDWIWRPLLLNRFVKPWARFFTYPLVALLVFDIFFSLWHLPSAYEAALQNSLLHHLEHVIFIATSIFMWWPVLSPLPELPRLRHGGLIIYLFLLPVGQFFVSALLSFATKPVYPTYINAPRVTGLSVVADQQLGGIIMKVSSFFAFGIPLAIAFFRWYQHENPSARRSVQQKVIDGPAEQPGLRES